MVRIVATRVQSFYDELAGSYDDLMSSAPSNWWHRQAFWQLVEARIDPASTVLDFGCGTGQDAEHFVEAGHRVLAYDLSPGMIDEVARRCRAAVEAGRVVRVSGSPDELYRRLAAFGPVHAVVSNFAVVNLIRDLTDFGGGLLGRLPECRWVFLAVQNPFWLGDMRSAWWWKGAARSLEVGAIPCEDAPVPTYRHFVHRIRSALGNTFQLDAQWSFVGRRLMTRFPGNRGGHLRLLAFRRR